MGQPITDYAAFFASAGQAVQELEALNTEVEQLEADEKKLESSLKGKQRSVTETISQTVKQRKEEITKSYDAELGKAQERLKKVKAKREKAKNQGVKERIEEDTRGLVRENKELADQIKTLFKANHVPGFCRGNYYYLCGSDPHFRRNLCDGGKYDQGALHGRVERGTWHPCEDPCK